MDPREPIVGTHGATAIRPHTDSMVIKLPKMVTVPLLCRTRVRTACCKHLKESISYTSHARERQKIIDTGAPFQS